jgi:hypothetical protein
VLAVGYDNGLIVLCDVENSEKLHSLQHGYSVTSLSWIAENISNTKENHIAADAPASVNLLGNDDCFQDMSAHFLPRLPQFSKRFGNVQLLPDLNIHLND